MNYTQRSNSFFFQKRKKKHQINKSLLLLQLAQKKDRKFSLLIQQIVKSNYIITLSRYALAEDIVLVHYLYLCQEMFQV